jgi:hypothetical protein
MGKTRRRLPDEFGRQRELHPRHEGSFRCRRCGREVDTGAPGTAHRNHCPGCLWSAHVDERPGDRSAGCGGGMEPIAVWVRTDGEWALVHRCGTCHAVRVNRIAGDDDELVLLSLAVRPLAQPPFPLDRLRRR